jgi:hypothetical protein
MPPAAIPSSVVITIESDSSSPRRSRNSSVGAGGNFGAEPQPPQIGSKPWRSAREASVSRLLVSGSRDG